MTYREKEVLEFIIQFKTINQYSPTIREIADGIHTASLTCVKNILERLREKGFIKFEENKPRTIVVTRFKDIVV